MKNIISLVLFIGLSLATVITHAGSSAAGKIIEIHQNGEVPGRGLCIQMEPALSTKGWACLYTNNALYKEITALLLTAYATGNRCSVSWNKLDTSEFANIAWLSCYSAGK